MGVLLVAAHGCRRDEVTHVRIAKAAGTGVVRSAQVADVPAATLTSTIGWTLPQGWTQAGAQLAGGMRYATLKPGVPGRVEVSVVVLAGTAGGELANVNRWRGQLGLPALDDTGLSAARATVRSKAGPFSVYDFANGGRKQSRMIAAAAALDGSTLFVKMLGDAGPVGAARSDFLHLLEGIHVDAAN
jgi:hypothetical protein